MFGSVIVFLVREQENYKQALPATVSIIQTLCLNNNSTGIQKNIAQLIEDLETASKNISPLIPLVRKPMVKEGRQKEKQKTEVCCFGNRKSRACVIFVSLGEPEMY